eukprot:gene23659-17511_t
MALSTHRNGAVHGGKGALRDALRNWRLREQQEQQEEEEEEEEETTTAADQELASAAPPRGDELPPASPQHHRGLHHLHVDTDHGADDALVGGSAPSPATSSQAFYSAGSPRAQVPPAALYAGVLARGEEQQGGLTAGGAVRVLLLRRSAVPRGAMPPHRQLVLLP